MSATNNPYNFRPLDPNRLDLIVSRILLSGEEEAALALVALVGGLAAVPDEVTKQDVIVNVAAHAHRLTDKFDRKVKRLIRRSARRYGKGATDERG